MSVRKQGRFIRRKEKDIKSSEASSKDTYFWTPGVAMRLKIPLDLEMIRGILSLHPWTVCSFVEEFTKGKNAPHTWIMIWAPQIPLGPTEIKWSAKELSTRLGVWPHIVPVVTQNNAITVTTLQCRQSLPTLWANNKMMELFWKQAVHDKTLQFREESRGEFPEKVLAFTAQAQKIKDRWGLYDEQEDSGHPQTWTQEGDLLKSPNFEPDTVSRA